MSTHTPGDPYSRVEYRRLIAWGPRIEREAPFLRRVLGDAPERSVLDIGCGTGEHTAFFAGEGCRALGLDRSESMIEAAREHEARGRGRFVLGDARDAAALIGDEPPFGMAVCLGNMLPHVTEDADLSALLAAVRSVLLPGGKLLIQLLNYAGIRERGDRYLPLSFRSEPDGEEIVFLRLMTPQADGRMLFFPTTLTLDPESEEPIAVRGTRRVELRAWTADELGPRMRAVGLEPTPHGDMQGAPFDRATSHDLVIVATAR